MDPSVTVNVGGGDYPSLPAMFFAKAALGAGGPRYMVKREGSYVTVSWAECLSNVREIASGLIGMGLAREDRVAILSSTRAEWMEADLAALAIGCVTVPIYPSSLAPECAYILVDSGARTVVVENPEQAEKVKEAARVGADVGGVNLTCTVENIVVMEGVVEGCLSLDEIKAAGRSALGRCSAEIEERTAELQSEQLATIVYTSGTTGLPKGVVQSHGNHLATVQAMGKMGTFEAGDVDFSFLPMAHSFGRLLEYLGIYVGTVTAYAEKIETITEDLLLARPHFMPAVPRVYEKIYARVQQTRQQSSAVKRAIFDLALAIGGRRAAYVNRGDRVPAVLGFLDSLAHRLVFARIQALFGGRMRYLISGGAPLGDTINAFFHAVGLPVLEGYGLTETTPSLTCNAPGLTRIGTVGMAMDGVVLKIAEDGEILAKGPNIAYGYYKKPEETSAAWDSQGWFHTGDIGELDDGFLRITDRKKELIKTSGGKYVAPQKIESLLKLQPLVSQAVVIGDRLKYCVALLTLDPDLTQAWAEANGRGGDFAEDPGEDRDFVAAVQEQVDLVNSQLAPFETIKRFGLIASDFTVEGGELTPSLKVKRKVVAEKYADLIASLVEP